MSIEENILTPNTKALYEKFYAKLKETVIPTMSDSMCYYDYIIENDSISLEMAHCDEIKLDNDGELSSSQASQIKTIFSIPCEYLTAEQFAKMHKVSKATVNKWLNHGELSSAKKDGENWLIPEIAQKPNDDFYCDFFTINNNCSEMTISKFPFLDNAECIKLSQDTQIAPLYHCTVDYKGNQYFNKYTFNEKDIEAIKVQLIADPNIECNALIGIVKRNFR